MKRTILSPLCSAFVIPGLGQVINQDLKKGLAVMAVVFALFIGGSVKLAFMIAAIMNRGGAPPSTAADVMGRLRGQGFTVLWVLILIFALVWIYSVLDAFTAARRLDRKEGGTSS